MKMLRKNVWVFALFGMVLTVSLCLTANSWAKEKVIVWVSPLEGVMDPHTRNDAESIEGQRLVYDDLVALDRNAKIIPALATSWDISPDYKEYTFHLRKGVKFHDGTPFNAQAVKFNFDRMLKLNKPCVGNYRSYADLNSVEVVDDYTVKFHLKKPYAIFIIDQINTCYHMISPDYVKKHATSDDPHAVKWMTEHASGTGPFKLVEYVPGERLVYEKFVEYWGGTERGRKIPKVDKVIHIIVKDPSTARLMLERGDVDVVERLTVEQFEKLKTTSGIKVANFKMPKLVYMAYDVTKPPFNDINVRKAIAHAIDYDEIIKYIEHGNVKRLHGFIPEGMPGNDPTIPLYPFDLAKAKEYMKASAYPNGFTTTMVFALERKAEFEQLSEYIQAYLKKIGINVNLRKIAFDVQLAMQKKGDYGLSLMTFSAQMPHADDNAGWVYDATRSHGGWNASHWYDKEVVEKLVKARSIFDPAQQEALYIAVDRKAVEQVVYILLYQLSKRFALRENIKNFNYDAYTHHYFWDTEKK